MRVADWEYFAVCECIWCVRGLCMGRSGRDDVRRSNTLGVAVHAWVFFSRKLANDEPG